MREIALEPRFTIHRLGGSASGNSFAEDVRRGLTRQPKQLLPKYFYDDLGILLFEAICRTDEYYLTRAERDILQTHSDEIVEALGRPARLLELGSGSAEKTRYLIEALLRHQPELHYMPVDISAASLERSSEELLHAYPQLRITAYAADYDTALAALASGPLALPRDGGTAGLFLGSNIGNFDPPEATQFLRAFRRVLGDGDAFLMGADLKKSPEILEAAYGDALGVTAAFNLNLLARINRELGGNFDLRAFEHHACYNAEEGRVEIYIASRRAQTVRIASLDLEIEFEASEMIHTENSYKFDLDQLGELGRQTGFKLERSWHDARGYFSFNQFRVASPA